MRPNNANEFVNNLQSVRIYPEGEKRYDFIREKRIG